MKINSKNILTILITLIMILSLGAAVMAQDDITIEQTIPAEIYPNDEVGQNYTAEIINNTVSAAGDLELVLNLPDGFSLSKSQINKIKIVDENNNESIISSSDYNFSENVNTYTITPVEEGVVLDAGSSIVMDYNLSTDASLDNQNKDLGITFNYLDQADSSLTKTDTETLDEKILFGELDIDLDLAPQPMHRGGEFTVTATVTNVGEGKLFDTTLTPNQSAGFSDPSFTSEEDSISGLGSGDSYTFEYNYTVVDNDNFETLELTAKNPATEIPDVTESANFRFNPRKPFIDIEPLTDPATIDFDTSNLIEIKVTNTTAGEGPARGIEIKSNIPAEYDVINLTDGWSYNAGVFTYDDGDFPSGDDVNYSETLSFNLQTDDPLNQNESGTITLQAEYTDDEDNPYSRPFETFNYNVTGIPTLNIKSSADTTASHTDTDRMYLGEEISYTYTVSLTEFDRFTNDDIVVELTNFDDTRLSYLSYNADGIGTFDPTTKTWTLTPSDLNGQDRSITIDFKITDDKTKAKDTVLTEAEVSGNLKLADNTEIPIADNTSNSFYLQSRYNEVDLNQQTKEIVNLPNEGSFDYTKTDNKHRVIYEVSYSFGGSSAGTWTGSTISDDMDNGQIYNDTDGFIQYSIDGGSTWDDVPVDNINSTESNLQFKLDFLAEDNNFGVDSVADKTVHFRYKLEVTQNGDFPSWTTLSLNGIDGSTDFYQVVEVPVSGAKADVDIDVQKNGSTANDIDKGEKVDLKIDVTKNPWMIKDLVVRIKPNGFTYGDYSDIKNSNDIEITGFGGYSPDISYDSTNELLIFDFSGVIGAGEFIDQNSTNTKMKNLGTITLNNMIKDCSETFTAGAEIDYRHGLIDSTEAPITKTNQSQDPLIKRKSDLIITAVNPVIVTEETVTWTIDITNTDIGTAHNTEFIGTFSEIFDYQFSQIDSVTATPQINTDNTQATATWNLGSIESGATKKLQITADITDADPRTIKDFSSAFSSQVKWYTEEVNNIKYECGNNTRDDFPQFVEPIKISDLVVKNNLVSPAEINICSEGFMEIIVQSTGQTRNYNLELRQDFLTTGIIFDETKDITVTNQNGSNTYSISASTLEDNNGNLVFKEETFPELAAIDIGEEIKIKFAIKTNGDFNESNEVQPAVSWNPPSKYNQDDDDQEFSKNGSIYKIPRIRPEINIDLKGRNETIGEQTFVDNPAAMAGKNTIRWKLDIENIGDGDAGNVWIESSDFPSSTVLYSDDNLQNSVDNNQSDNYWVVPNLAAGESQSYYLEYTVPASSNETENINADVSWGCDDNNRLSTPGKSSDQSSLTTVPEITFSHENLNNNLTRKDGTIVLTMVNTGAPIYNLDFDYKLSNRYKMQSITSYSSNPENNEVDDNWEDYNTEPAADDSLDQISWSYDLPIAAGSYQIEFELIDNVAGGNPRVSDEPIEINPTLDASYDYLNSNSENESFNLNNLTPKSVELAIAISPEKQIISDLANDVEWTISVTNNGNAEAVNTNVEQELGDGFDYNNLNYTIDTSYQGNNFSYSFDSTTGILSWTDLEIPADGTAEIIVTTKMSADGSHTNTVQAEEISPYTNEVESITEVKEAYTAAFNLNKELITTDKPSSGYFAPGEIVEYQVTADLIGNLNYKNLTIIDDLPSGLKLDDTITDHQSSDPTLAFNNNTTEGQLEWSGTIDGSASQKAVINYKLRVVKDGVSRGDLITNTAEASFDIDYLNDSNDSNDIQFTADNSILNNEALIDSSEFNFEEPELTISRSADNSTVVSSTVLEHTLSVSNGTAANISPAYQTKIVETIPAGFRVKEANILSTVVIEKADGTDLIKNTDYDLEYNNTNHQLIITFKDTVNSVLNPAEKYIIKYQTEANNDIQAGLNYTFSAELEEYYSVVKNVNDAQKYPAADQTITADKTFNGSSSTFTANSDITNVSPGDTVNYNLSFLVPAKTTVTAFNLSAELPEGLEFIEGSVNGPGTPESTTGNDLSQWEPAQITGNPENGGQSIVFPDGGVTVKNDSSEDYEYRLSFQAKILNIDAVSNGNSLNSDFSYSYNGNPLSDSVSLTVVEPELTLSKAFENVSGENSYEAGDTVEYTITINHSGSSTAAAYDLTVEDIIPAGMSYVSGTMTSSVDSLSITANDSGPNLIWTVEELAQTYDSTNKLELTYQATLDNSVKPAELLTNAAELTWTSHPDNTNPDQRTGAAGDSLNDYIQTTETNLTINDDSSIVKSKDSTTFVDDSYVRIGDLVTYKLEIDIQKGTSTNFVVKDQLPQGMKYVDTLRINGDEDLNQNNLNGYQYQDISISYAETPDRKIIWNLGYITNPADGVDRTFTIVYQAQVIDDESLIQDSAPIILSNPASISYDGVDNSRDGIEDIESITLNQPKLALTISDNIANDEPVVPGDKVSYTIKAENTGLAPAYDTVLEGLIPEGLRDAGISNISITINGDDRNDINPVIDADGNLSWSLSSGTGADDYTIPVGGELVIAYDLTVDQELPYKNIGKASIDADYYSFGENDIPIGANLDDRRQYEADQVSTDIIDIKDAAIDTDYFEYFKETNENVTKVVLTRNGRSLESIQDADGNLLGNDDYSEEIGDNGKPIITLSKDYLDNQDLGEINLIFNMNYGTDPELTVKINQYQSDVDLKDPTEITAGQEQPITFTFKDKDENPIKEKEVTLSEDGLGNDDKVEYSLDGENWVDDITDLNDGLLTDENGQVKVFVRSEVSGEKGTVSAAVDSEIVKSGELEIVPDAFNRLGFVEQPQDNFVGQKLDSVEVGVLDQFGNIITDYENGNITIKIKNNPADGTLSGNSTAVIENGIATFDGLSIDEEGRGYTFEAEDFDSVISDEFNIKANIELDNYNISTNDSTPTISGTVDDLDSDQKVDVVIRDEDGEIVFEGEAEVNEDGSWSIDVDQSLDLGEYEVEASIADGAGNTSTTTGVLEVYPTDIIINKTAAEKQVSIGDFISYKIEIINETNFDLDSFTLYDKLPAGFRFVKDSAVIVSETGSETKLKTEGNRLVSWEGLELNAESSMEIRYTLVVGSGVVNSNTYINQAYAKVGENLISNTAEAEVLVIEDPLFTTSTVIGKVYLDQNEDRMQTEGEAEKGLEGIRIISTTGQIVETDQFGRFHFEIRAEGNIQPMQTLVLKLDKNSLPAGAEILSKNPVIVKIREGLMFEVNFRIK
ncbi:Ig-like domain-containing protein [Halanaerobium congolense]|uniref:Conserved repeat domain-containing protein n=1 Tax=Halanaerobium congolense TaxID=54121 RepID=A0A1G6Q978_9FIRM|nr:Ig-like domain-containing protein [Halanaerobium congolense]SDC88771.1 conserved repeat domain-containing protein [Halanaerobium congolense]